MKSDSITSPVHARRLLNHAETEYERHLEECATCETSHRPCSIAVQLRAARDRYASIRRSFRREDR